MQEINLNSFVINDQLSKRDLSSDSATIIIRYLLDLYFVNIPRRFNGPIIKPLSACIPQPHQSVLSSLKLPRKQKNEELIVFSRIAAN